MDSGLLRRLRWFVPALAGIAFAILVSVLGGAPGRAASVPLSISISGNHFVNGAGQTIRLLGVNHTSSEYGCAQGFGYDDGHFDDADAAVIASWGANAVRIPLNEDCWLGINGQPNSSQGANPPLTQAGYQQEIENYVTELNAHGIYAILDLHWTAPGTQVALEQQPMPDQAHSPAFWTSVASAFKGNPAVAFDLFNEPYDPTDPRSGGDQNASDAVTWGCWQTGTKPDPVGGGAPPIPCYTQAYDQNNNPTTTYQIAGMQALLDAIRATGAKQPVLAGGLDYANDLSQWATNAPDDPLNQEAAAFHNYMGKACDHAACWNTTIAGVAASVPVVTGEFAEDNYLNSTCPNKTPNTFDQDYMTWADQHGVSYLAWAWGTETQAEQQADKCDAHILISDYNGTPAAPNGTAVHDHLVALAKGSGTTTTTTTTTSTTTTGSTTTTTKTTPTSRPAITLRSFSAGVAPGGSSVRFTLRSPQSCTGTLTGRTAGTYAVTAAKSKRRRIALGTVHFALKAAKSKTVVLRLSRASKRLLTAKHSLTVQITITLTSAGHRTTVLHRTTTLKSRPRRRR